MSWNTLRKSIKECVSCPLVHIRTNALPGEGNVKARLFLIAQAPGPAEDRTGKMFTGPSGPLLDGLLGQAGFTRKDVYLTNLIKCQLPKCRRPSKGEITACTPYLLREIDMVKPKVLVPLGFHATRFLFMHFNIPRPERKDFHTLFGREFGAGDYIICPLRHPTALLFNPDKRNVMERNYRKLKKWEDGKNEK